MKDTNSPTEPQALRCAYGDPTCPCQDGDLCHYEGKDPMNVRPEFVRAAIAAAVETEREALANTYSWSGMLFIMESAFTTRPSMQEHPLRGTHVNDVPVIAAEEALQAIKDAIRARGSKPSDG